ncbi:unnamed protein product [Sphagnum jensenii]|uniref:F-box/LRR-repeat protein 15/At3g58940/PEG3-like LRR domain-containing protein n=1 Tax=Sphagnum jensenii TaxID=128206 RepID=A0ABP0W120_9BRYO
MEIKRSVLEKMGEILEFEGLVSEDTDFMLTKDPVVKISFLSLTSLTLKEIRVSGADLHALLLACPELQFLSLTNVFDICSSESGVTLEFTSFSLKAITLKG